MSNTVALGAAVSDASAYPVHAEQTSPLPQGLGEGDGPQLAPIVEGPATPPVFINDGPKPATLFRGFLHDFYFRIWVLPAVINAQNPQIGNPIPFVVWNAFPEPETNVLRTITANGATGLELSFGELDSWNALEAKGVTITITPSAPVQIDALFTFTFDHGSGDLIFSATIADFVQMRPDPPVVELWDWLTDVMVSHEGDEQRVALRGAPRRHVSYEIGLENEADRRRQYGRWYKSLATRLVLPYYQYSTALTQESVIGATKLFFDPARTDVRDDEFVVLLDEAQEQGFLVKLGAVEADGATLADPLSFDAKKGWVLAPAFASRLADRSGLDMYIVTGKLKVDAQALDVRPQFARPGSTAVVSQFDDLPVLDRRPIATEGDTPERFDVNYEVIDSETGLLDIKSSWPHPQVETVRKFTIRRVTEPGEMDWWRDFLDEVRGMQRPFLMPTWLSDLAVAEAPTPGSGELVIASTEYEGLYWVYDTFKRLQIELADGRTLWRKVAGVVDNGDGTQTLSLDGTFGPDPADVDVAKVSFLNKCRLGSDRVTLRHGHLRTVLELTTRTIDE